MTRDQDMNGAQDPNSCQNSLPLLQRPTDMFLLAWWIISFDYPASFISNQNYSSTLPLTVLGGVRSYVEINHRYLELSCLHSQRLQTEFSNCRAGTRIKHIKPSIFYLDINMKLHCAKPYDNYISLANIYGVPDILIIKQLNPSLQLDINVRSFCRLQYVLYEHYNSQS